MKLYNIPQLTKQYVDYDMISKYTGLPDFPETRVRLLNMFLQDSVGLTPKEQETVVLATATVQMALDMHDKIDPKSIRKDLGWMRSRQLQVLGGDYYSSLFYVLLAESGQIELISSMGRAISDLNRLKVIAYTKRSKLSLSPEQYLQDQVQLNTRLFLSFTPLLENSKQQLWEQLLTELAFCELLVQEMKLSVRLPEMQQGYAYWSVLEQGNPEEQEKLRENSVDITYWKSLLHKYNIEKILIDKLGQCVDKVYPLIQHHEVEQYRSELIATLEPFNSLLSQATSCIEGQVRAK